MKTAIITGIAGQDGKYLSRLLLEKGYKVVGTTRHQDTARHKLSDEIASGLELYQLDLGDETAIADLINNTAPDEFYNLAAFARGSTMWDQAVELSETNGMAVARILEAIRNNDPTIRFCQASSSEMFGQALISPQTEGTGFAPRSPYGAAKLYAHNMVNIYRAHHDLFACSAILFNHESPERSTDFVTRKITQCAAKIKLGMAKTLALGNLEACRDWGFAGDYMQAMWMMLQHESASNYIVATGEVQSVRKLCDIAFSHLGLDYSDYVTSEADYYREREEIQLVGDSSRARTVLEWSPQVSFSDLIHTMVDHDLDILQRTQE